jgi:DNA (cytosine-5)-methyltransferase 1
VRIGSLFSGIGGLELGLERSGLGHTVWQVEKDPYCLEVLAKHWPNARRFTDVSTVTGRGSPFANLFELEPVDLVCGGFPCQDVSSAGKRVGLGGARSGLWSEYVRIVDELRPGWVVVENVASGAGRWVDAVRMELAERGYCSLPVPLAARDVGAPHRRSRIFVIGWRGPDSARNFTEALAHRRRDRPGVERARDDARKARQHHEPRDESHGRHASVGGFPPAMDDDGGWERWIAAGGPPPGVLPGADGFPRRVARRRIAALGNSVVPACAEVVGWMIREMIAKMEGRMEA